MSSQMHEADVFLSIAIPTYNRAEFLKETLNHIIPQVVDGVEIVVSSNASTDHTDVVMQDYVSRHPFIRFVRSDVNRGIDGNIHRCTLESRGKYVHLMSDDDIVLPGTVAHLLETIKKYPEAGFLFFNLQSFSGEFRTDNLCSPIFRAEKDIVFADKNKFIDYIWVFATFMSSFVFSKDTWSCVENKEKYIGTDIYLSYVMFEQLNHTTHALFIARPSIAVRAQYTGSYRIFYAFAHQWSRLLLERAIELGYDKKTMRRVFNRTIILDLVARVYFIKSRRVKSSIDKQSLQYIFASTYSFPSAWLLLYPSLVLPSKITKLLLMVCQNIYLFLEQRKRLSLKC